jgi:hypothetical protein
MAAYSKANSVLLVHTLEFQLVLMVFSNGLEDIAMFRTIFNSVIFYPADASVWKNFEMMIDYSIFLIYAQPDKIYL